MSAPYRIEAPPKKLPSENVPVAVAPPLRLLAVQVDSIGKSTVEVEVFGICIVLEALRRYFKTCTCTKTGGVVVPPVPPVPPVSLVVPEQVVLAIVPVVLPSPVGRVGAVGHVGFVGLVGPAPGAVGLTGVVGAVGTVGVTGVTCASADIGMLVVSSANVSSAAGPELTRDQRREAIFRVMGN